LKGRTIFENVQKFVVFFLGTNVPQIMVIFACIAAGLPSPLTPLQILFLNLAVDGIGAVALSTEPGSSSLMQQPPRARTAPLLDANKRLILIVHIFSLLTCCLVGFFFALWREEGTSPAQTVVFLTFALSENLRLYTLRSFDSWLFTNIFANKYLLIGSAVSFGCTMLLVFLPDAQQVFSLTTLTWELWLLVVGCAVFTAFVDEVAKAVLTSHNELRHRWLRVESGVSELLLELRALRGRVTDLQDNHSAHFDVTRQFAAIARPAHAQRVVVDLPLTQF
jgi:Ca2+-transporting ATPase